MQALRRNLLKTFSTTLLNPRMNRIEAISGLNLKYLSAHNNPYFKFSTNLEKEKKSENVEDVKKASKNESNQEEIIEENLTEFMKNPELKSDAILEFTDRDVFKFNGSQTGYRRQSALFGGMGTLWTVLAGATYGFIHPYAAVVPGLVVLMAIRGYVLSKFSTKKLVSKLELVDSFHVKLYTISEPTKSEMCRIEDIEVNNITELTKKDDKNLPTTYLLKADFKDVSGSKKFENMTLIIDPKLTNIENPDLFKSIIYARVRDISRFRYIKTSSQTDSEKIEDDLPVHAEREPKFKFSEEEFEQLKNEVNKQKTPDNK